jgi:TRAP-type C4-dicarboxylate transport system permease small subunit
MPRISSFQQTQERYRSLRILSVICGIIGTLLMIVAGLLFAYASLQYVEGRIGPALAVAFWAAGCGAASVQSFASAALFLLAIHIEENTRATAQAVARLQAAMEPKPAENMLVFES